MKKTLVPVTGLWSNVSKDGDTFFKGHCGSMEVLVLRNKFKTKDSQPDFSLFFTTKDAKKEWDKKDTDTDNTSSFNKTSFDSDDIPF